MIQMQTQLRVVDNSGGKYIRCIRVLKKGAFSRRARLGDLIVASVQLLRDKNRFLSKVKKGDVVYAVIVKTKMSFLRQTGYSFKSDTNAVVLLTKQLKPIGTRVFGAIPLEFRSTQYAKLLSISSGIT